MEREAKKQRGRRVVTEVKRAAVFWPGERYHQRKLQKKGRAECGQEVRRARALLRMIRGARCVNGAT